MIEPLFSTLDAVLEKAIPLGATFDETKARKPIEFISELKHAHGAFVGKPFKLAEWQEWWLLNLYGWQLDGARLFRSSMVGCPSGAGKTELLAALILFELMKGQFGGEVLGFAWDKAQAKRAYDRMRRMILQHPTLVGETEILKQPASIKNPRKDATYTVVSSATADGIWGALPSMVLVDELHVVPRESYNAIEDMVAKSENSILVSITTAGLGDVSRHSPAYELYDLTKRIAEGEDVGGNLSFLGVWFGASEDDDWTSEKTWEKANPSWGISPPARNIREEYEKALKTPSRIPHFKTIRLNLWQEDQVDGLLDMEAWDKCSTDWSADDLSAEWFGGLDISSRIDLSAFVMVAETDGRIRVMPHFFLPEDGIYDRSKRDRIPYDTWAEKGYLTLVPGPSIDQRFVKEYILEQANRFKLMDISFDPWSARQLASELEEAGIPMWEVRQGMASLSEPTKKLQELVLAKKLDTLGNHPILRAHAAAAVAKVDENGNVRPDRKRSATKIDGVIGLVLAIDGWSRRGQILEADDEFVWL